MVLNLLLLSPKFSTLPWTTVELSLSYPSSSSPHPTTSAFLVMVTLNTFPSSRLVSLKELGKAPSLAALACRSLAWMRKVEFSPAVARARAVPVAVAFAPRAGPADTLTSNGLPDTCNPFTRTVDQERESERGVGCSPFFLTNRFRAADKVPT